MDDIEACFKNGIGSFGAGLIINMVYYVIIIFSGLFKDILPPNGFFFSTLPLLLIALKICFLALVLSDILLFVEDFTCGIIGWLAQTAMTVILVILLTQDAILKPMLTESLISNLISLVFGLILAFVRSGEWQEVFS